MNINVGAPDTFSIFLPKYYVHHELEKEKTTKNSGKLDWTRHFIFNCPALNNL